MIKIWTKLMNTGGSETIQMKMDGSLHEIPNKKKEVTHNTNHVDNEDVKEKIDVQLTVEGELTTREFFFRFILLCTITFCHILSLRFSFYATNEYAYDRIRRKDFPDVILNKSSESICTKNLSALEKEIEDEIQSKVSQWSVYVALASGIPAIFSTSLFSTLSDSYGRKRFLLVTVFGTVLKNGLIAVGIHQDLSINWFILFSFLEGATGNWMVTLSVSFAYIADLTPTGKSRTIYMVSYELSVQIASSIGILVPGFYVDSVGYFYPVLTATAVSLVSLLCIIVLPETKRNDGPRKNILEKFKVIAQFLYGNEEGKRLKYILCILSMVLIWIGLLGQGGVTLFFLMGNPFCFNAVGVSIFNTANNIFQEVSGVVLIKVFKTCFRNEVITIISSVSAIAYYIMFGFAKNLLTLIFASAVGVFSLSAVPLLRVILSHMTRNDQQGAVFALIAFFENISGLLGSTVSGEIYSGTTSIFRGFAFCMMALYQVIATAVLVILAILTRKNTYENLEEEEVPHIRLNE